MLQEAAAERDIELARSYLIGDRWRDIGAGKAAGCTTVLVDSGHNEPTTTEPDERKHDHDGRKRSWQERKDEHLRHIAAEPWEARAIVLADKLHNLGSMVVDLDSGQDLWSRFNAPRERMLWYHREMVAAAFQDDPRLASLAAECQQLIARLA